MKIAVVGLWHLGCVAAACVAAENFETIGIDDDAARVDALARGEPPLYEPGLAELIRSSLASGYLRFTLNVADVAAADVVWVCHDTPVDDDDRADVEYVMQRVEALFSHLKDGAVVLVSAQLPVGSIATLEQAYARRQDRRRVAFACSPENLRLGRAIQAFQSPSRIVVGVRDQRSRTVLEPLLARFCDRLIWVTVESAEMIKHALNAFLATSITLTNEIATLCERVGADAAELEAGLRSDPRIGESAYIKAGPAFAGGTLARDIQFLGSIAHRERVEVPVIDGVLPSNRAHSQWALAHLRRALQPLSGRTVAVLGLAYKAGTSALRRSIAIDLTRALAQGGVQVRAFDPQVRSLPSDLGPSVTLVQDALTAVRGADALVVATEWPEFRQLVADDVANAMAGTIVLDPGGFLGPSFARHPRLSRISVGLMK